MFYMLEVHLSKSFFTSPVIVIFGLLMLHVMNQLKVLKILEYHFDQNQ